MIGKMILTGCVKIIAFVAGWYMAYQINSALKLTSGAPAFLLIVASVVVSCILARKAVIRLFSENHEKFFKSQKPAGFITVYTCWSSSAGGLAVNPDKNEIFICMDKCAGHIKFRS